MTSPNPNDNNPYAGSDMGTPAGGSPQDFSGNSSQVPAGGQGGNNGAPAFPQFSGQNDYGQGQALHAGSKRPGVWKRLGAYLLEAIPLGIVSGILAKIFAGSSSNDVASLQSSATKVGALIFLLWFAYRIYMETSRGGSIGKSTLGIKMVNASGQHLTMQQSAIRNSWIVLGILQIFGSFFSTLEFIALVVIFISIAVDKDNRSVFDKMASAFAVNTK